jgi:hypothetical protein
VSDPLGVTVPALIGRDDEAPRREQGRDLAPACAEVGEAMDENKRGGVRAVPRLEVCNEAGGETDRG